MCDIAVSYEGDELNIDGTTVSMDYPVQKVIVHKGRVIVLVEPPSDVNISDNIISLNEHGDVLWRIESPSPEGDMPTTFSDINQAGNEIIAISWDGNSYAVDVQTGEIEYRTWSK